MQEFTAPVSGDYKLEVWGAQGQGQEQSGIFGGRGGYSCGHILLAKDQNIFVCCGGVGKYGLNGGYNGAECTFSGQRSGWLGGGATHIATTNRGILKNYDSYRSEIIMVAGGGGGSERVEGGGGGGKIGGNGADYPGINGGTGGSQETAGQTHDIGYVTIIEASFGQGAIGYSSDGDFGGNGGGGWYGGGAAPFIGAGGGGSGYIGHPSLTNKHMAGYQVEISDDIDTKTISVSVSSSDPIADCAKDGDGYAIITWFPLSLQP